MAGPDGAPKGLGVAIAGVGDVNGDGFDDAVLGRYGASEPLEYQGRASVHLGSAAGLGAAAAWEVVGERTKDFLGSAVSGAGDVNGDGFDDILVGSGRCGPARQRGCTDLYLGSASGLSAHPDWTFARDLGNDWYGHALAGAGDVDGDGYGDFLVGGPGGSEGSVLLFRGGPHGPGPTPDWEVHRPRGFGFVVTGAGDVNGDGFDDVGVGAAGGGLWVWSGSAAGLGPDPSWTFFEDEVGARPGWSMASAGDVNGDGFDDLVAGAPYLGTPAAQATAVPRRPDRRPPASDVGRVVVFFGSAGGLSASPDWAVEGSVRDEHLGTAVVGVGDRDGDGFGDLALGAPRLGKEDEWRGAYAVFAGGPDGPGATPVRWVTGDDPQAALGRSLAAAGDVDGDGRADLLVGAPGDDDTFSGGRVWVDRAVGPSKALAALPRGLFAPESGPVVARSPWVDNEVLRDWPFACPVLGLHDSASRQVPRKRWVRGFTFQSGVQRQACAEGSGSDVAPHEVPAGAVSPADAVADWNTGAVRADWCQAEADTWLTDGPLLGPARLDPSAVAEWRFIGWSDAPDRSVKACPWRRVLRVPVLAEVAGGTFTGTVSLWLVVTSADPANWTLTTRGAAHLAALATLVEQRAATSGADPKVDLGFLTDGWFGHRQLKLTVWSEGSEGVQSGWVDGQWRWKPARSDR